MPMVFSDFLRENGFCCSEHTLAELLESLRAVLCPYTYEVTPYCLHRLFLSKATVTQAATTDPRGLSWTEFEQVQPQQPAGEQVEARSTAAATEGSSEEEALCLGLEALIRLLASLDYCAAVWSPSPSKARIVAPSCIRASLRFLWDAFDLEKKGTLDFKDISDFWTAVSASLSSRGFPSGSLLPGSVELELLDRLKNKGTCLRRSTCINDMTHGRIFFMVLLSPAFFQLFDQREHVPGRQIVSYSSTSCSDTGGHHCPFFFGVVLR
ncbi:hypothetical protein cyc_02342 [Cyclospora cayetanensis]|uniref:EF-hand domain-containing protein n=1 Tax=Cyclospora cayetanensis TaxID=88456 RepID=A0A1D3DAR0_9EIME|nr:hypothetical protein cyc_02342 [Cyclospora cayetanensis]